jgi:low affinity Fe/Cu permease
VTTPHPSVAESPDDSTATDGGFVNARPPHAPLVEGRPRKGPPAPPVGPHHPVIDRLDAQRAADFELRLADRITAFAGSMPFVYLHVVAFAVWMLVLEESPWPTLTLAVSLEAIFLSTFVMIGQNRQAAFQQAKADHEFAEEEQELKLNTELTREIRDLTREVHEHVVAASGAPAGDDRSPG